MSNNNYIINASNVQKTYRSSKNEVKALQGIDLQIKAGEMVAVMGPSGCGKTTLLNCLSGLDTIDGGEVLLEGESIHDMPDRRRTELRRKRMGFVFQSYNLLPVLSSIQNVELPLIIGGTPRREAHDLATNMLEMVDRLDHVVLFSGDGDFRRLVEVVQRRGVQVTVVSTTRSSPPMVADELRRQCDEFIELRDLEPEISRPREAAVHQPVSEFVP